MTCKYCLHEWFWCCDADYNKGKGPHGPKCGGDAKVGKDRKRAKFTDVIGVHTGKEEEEEVVEEAVEELEEGETGWTWKPKDYVDVVDDDSKQKDSLPTPQINVTKTRARNAENFLSTFQQGGDALQMVDTLSLFRALSQSSGTSGLPKKALPAVDEKNVSEVNDDDFDPSELPPMTMIPKLEKSFSMMSPVCPKHCIGATVEITWDTQEAQCLGCNSKWALNLSYKQCPACNSFDTMYLTEQQAKQQQQLRKMTKTFMGAKRMCMSCDLVFKVRSDDPRASKNQSS